MEFIYTSCKCKCKYEMCKCKCKIKYIYIGLHSPIKQCKCKYIYYMDLHDYVKQRKYIYQYKKCDFYLKRGMS